MDAAQPPDWRQSNRRYWDERVPVHVAGDFYDLEGFRAGEEPLRDFELAEVGDVTGKTLVHLQCHIGTDTLGWARRGAARVVGLDFSGAAVRAKSFQPSFSGRAFTVLLPPCSQGWQGTGVHHTSGGVRAARGGPLHGGRHV